MTEPEKRDLIERYLSAYNAFDVDGMMDTLHPQIEFENISGGEVNATASGADEFRQIAQRATGLFSSRNQTVRVFEANEKGAAIEVSYEGVLAADLPNGMKAGEILQLNGRSEFEFKEGKISRIVDRS
ncbi:MAG: nuclear transport factor 2 family protein [Cyanobacteriota bacterium]|nr:nuclear transport factor 2 family protein [Cyanobacteriota bacterium]